jgi:hypothetical protein
MATINIAGSNNDSNLVLTSPNATITDNGTSSDLSTNSVETNLKDERMYAPLKIISDAKDKDQDGTNRKGRYSPGVYQVCQYDSYCDNYYPEYLSFVPFNFFEPLFMQNCPGARPGWMATINLFDAKPMWNVPKDLIANKSVQRLWYIFHLILS